jgi:Uma2 family endonuclease
MPSTARRRLSAADPTVYPVEEMVGEDLLQRLIIELLRPLIVALFAKRNKKALVGADQFIYWERYNARKVVAPDLYVLPGVDSHQRVKAWKVWETGIVPSFALEVMGDDERKDVEQSPNRYAELGTKELIVFDPEPERRVDGVRFRVFRRVGKRGLVLVETTDEDRVKSKELACWLRAMGEGDDVRLRVGLGLRGEDLLQTEQERAQRAERERDAEKTDRERAERERDAEKTDRERAEREVQRLRAMLESRSR